MCLDTVHKQAKKFVAEVKAESYNGICSYGYSNGGSFEADTNDQCHIGLNYKKEEAKYVVDVIYPHGRYKNKASKTLRTAFIDYIINCPAYSGVIVKQEASEIWKQGYVIANVDVPSNQLAGCLFSLRMGHERPDLLETWDKLVESGVDKDLAYVMCYFLKADGDNIQVNEPDEGHTGLCVGKMGMKAVYNFLEGNKIKCSKPLAKEGYGYDNVGAMFGGKDGEGIKKVFLNYRKNHVAGKKQKKVKEKPYLFYREQKVQVQEGRKFKYDEQFIDVLLSFNKDVQERKL